MHAHIALAFVVTAIALAAPLAYAATADAKTGSVLNAELTAYLADRATEFDQIPTERRAQLDRLAEYTKSKSLSSDTLKMIFVCTHNSRRSHMSQLWAAASAKLHGIDLESYSGGTEDTAFNPRAVASLRRAGFTITQTANAANPLYHIAMNDDPADTLTCWSKAYDNPPNPKDKFAAVMVCSDADETCPAVFGEDFHIALPFIDPKVSDNTPAEAETYDERCAQIAREMLYVFTKANS
ncbi:MAG: protein-tyrosine-phosphatase [Planctomycetota bacterium]